MQSLANFQCHSNCKHRECLRHVRLGVIDQNIECECLQQELDGSSIFLENIIDLSHTLAQVMIICGIHECKAKTSIDIITYAFLHYDLVCYCLDTKPAKRLRKEDIFHELGRKCLMNRVEAHLAYTIIKRGFKAFYYKPKEQERNEEGKPSFSEECLYVHAARKTAESYATFDGLTCDEQRGIEAKIKVAYKKFFDRMQSRKAKPSHDNCHCCFCTKNRDHLIYAPPPPCTAVEQPKKPHSCPHCCKRKKSSPRLIHGKSAQATCPVCHRSRKFCSCAKYEYNIQWVNSIWSRPDMDLYYKETIEKAAEAEGPSCQTQCGEVGEGAAGAEAAEDVGGVNNDDHNAKQNGDADGETAQQID